VNTPANPAFLRQRLEERGISMRAAAARLRVNPGHLRRVLRGERQAKPKLLQTLSTLVEAMEQPRPKRQPEDIERLIGAAMHMFFLKRGRFDSPICARVQRPAAGDEDEFSTINPQKYGRYQTR